jgi:hypothetical protein
MANPLVVERTYGRHLYRRHQRDEHERRQKMRHRFVAEFGFQPLAKPKNSPWPNGIITPIETVTVNVIAKVIASFIAGLFAKPDYPGVTGLRNEPVLTEYFQRVRDRQFGERPPTAEAGDPRVHMRRELRRESKSQLGANPQARSPGHACRNALHPLAAPEDCRTGTRRTTELSSISVRCCSGCRLVGYPPGSLGVEMEVAVRAS